MSLLQFFLLKSVVIDILFFPFVFYCRFLGGISYRHDTQRYQIVGDIQYLSCLAYAFGVRLNGAPHGSQTHRVGCQ